MTRLTYIPCQIDALIGSIVRAVEIEADGVTFMMDDYQVRFAHEQDCCESVEFVDTDVPLVALIGDPIIEAGERTNNTLPPQYTGDQDFLWTFYTIRTAKASCTMRWYGNSEYYSVSIDVKLGINLRSARDTMAWKGWPEGIMNAFHVYWCEMNEMPERSLIWLPEYQKDTREQVLALAQDILEQKR